MSKKVPVSPPTHQGTKISALAEMSGYLSHEINNPISIVIGRLELIKNKADLGAVPPEFLLANLNKALIASRRIASVITSLRKFSNTDEIQKQSVVPVLDVVSDALMLCLERLKTVGIDVQLDIPETVFMTCNALQFSQVIFNLIDNTYDAIKNTENAWLKIEATQNEKSVLIKIIDSGKGIPEEIAKKMMEPFFTTKEVGQGSGGLGLSVSQGMIQGQGGKLYYDPSSPNTCFVIEMPLKV